MTSYIIFWFKCSFLMLVRVKNEHIGLLKRMTHVTNNRPYFLSGQPSIDRTKLLECFQEYEGCRPLECSLKV